MRLAAPLPPERPTLTPQRADIDILDSCFGRPGRAAASFFQFSFAFGGMCAFCVIIGDTIPRVLLSLVGPDASPVVSFFISRPVVTTILTLSISYPLSLYRDIEKLSHASALALIRCAAPPTCFATRPRAEPLLSSPLRGTAWSSLSSASPCAAQASTTRSRATRRSAGRCSSPDSSRPSASSRLPSWCVVHRASSSQPTLTVAIPQCHHNSLLIYGSLRTPTLDRFARVTHVSTTVSVIACLCMSTSGFLVFTDRTSGNVLNNFSEDDTLINIARACVCPLVRLARRRRRAPTDAALPRGPQFGANMFTTLPLEAFVCREVAETYFWPDEREFNKKRHVLITTALVLSALVGASLSLSLPRLGRARLTTLERRTVSLITCDLGFILELAGGFSATALAYLFRASHLLPSRLSHPPR